MAKVILKDLDKVYPNGFQAVYGHNLEIRDGEFLVFVGPSGCAKSTTLRMIAGLEDISGGEIRIGDTVVNDLAPKDRNIAMVFQNYALYPHMDVYDNMAFGLKLQKFPKEEIDQRVKEAAKILGITDLLDRKPKAMSGGQRQRVALGRAIVRQPKVFLFDEPLSNLDAKLRVHMRVELTKLHQQLKTTMIYVTHDQIEAMTMGDRICVMKLGVIQQTADPVTLYEEPVNKFVATFIGSPSMNVVAAKLTQEEDGIYVDFEEAKLKLPKVKAQRVKDYAGKEIWFGIRPEKVESYELNQDKDTDILEAKIDVVEHMGSEVYAYFTLKGGQFIAQLEPHVTIKAGDTYKFWLDMENCHIFDKKTEENISL
ncbi:MAG: ABC transporter ATP-binding protein [Fusobacteriota bacterium]